MKKALLFLLLLVALGCSRGLDSRVALADSLMWERPDSALSILESIDTASLTAPSDRARYALLLTQARHKNNIFETDDSLIASAVSYYDEHGPDSCRMLSLFYHAVVLNNSGNHSAAMGCLLPALDIATQHGNAYWMARIHDLTGDIHVLRYNIKESISSYYLAAENFKKSGRALNEIYSLMSAARSMDHHGMHHESVRLLDSIRDHIDVTDSIAIGFLYESFVRPYMYFQKYDEAIAMHKKGLSYLGRANEYLVDWMDIATIYSETGNKAGRDSCYLLGLKYVNVPSQRNILKKDIFVAEADYKNAYYELDSVYSYAKKVFYNTLNDDYDVLVSSYYASVLSRNNSKHIIMVILLSSIALLLIIISISIYLYFRHQLKNRKQQLELYLYQIRDMIEKEGTSQKDISELNSKIKESESLIKKLSERIYLSSSTDKELKFIDIQIKLINDICYNLTKEIYTKDSVDAQMSENIICLLKNLVNDSYISQLESLLNRHHDGIISRLKKHVKSLTYNDYVLISLRCAGYSSKSVSIIMGIRMSNFHNRMSRLRLKILDSDEPGLLDEFNNLIKL